MGVIFHSDGSVEIGTDMSAIPFSGLHFQVFGEGINLSKFSELMQQLNSDVVRQLTYAALRLQLVDHLAASRERNHDLKIDPLQLYLLCSCIDALANPNWLPFHSWLRTKKAKHQIVEREHLLLKFESLLNDHIDRTMLLGLFDDLHSIYLSHHGTQKKFGWFFTALPGELQKFIADSYQIYKGSETFFDPQINQSWKSLSLPNKLETIAKYLFEYRRNDFTHAGKTYATTWSDLARSLDELKGGRTGYTILSFYEDDDLDKPVKLSVLSRENETFLLRTVILGYCRSLIGLYDSSYVDLCIDRKTNTTLVTKCLDELEGNWQTYKYYSIEWMALEDDDDRYSGLPEFSYEWLSAHEEINFHRFGIVPENAMGDIKSYIANIKAINSLIQKVNHDHPPLYLRHNRADLKDQPEDLEAKSQAKHQLGQAIRNTMEYHHLRWISVQLIELFRSIKLSLYGQDEILTYSYSYPKYRKYL